MKIVIAGAGEVGSHLAKMLNNEANEVTVIDQRRERLDSVTATTDVITVLPWLGSNDALPLATRMETRLPWRPTRGSLTSPSYLVRKRTLGPPLENNPKTPPSSRDEGLRLLHGLETNLATSLQTPQEA